MKFSKIGKSTWNDAFLAGKMDLVSIQHFWYIPELVGQNNPDKGFKDGALNSFSDKSTCSDEFQFGGLEKIKHQRNSAAAMTQFPISITLKLFFF